MPLWRRAAAASTFEVGTGMTRNRQDAWVHCFAYMLAAATLFLVALGGVVTTKGVGMAVPDWPTTYGDHMFLFPYSKWVGGVFYEHSHRVWGSIVGLLTAGLLLWVWIRDSKGTERTVGIIGVIAALALMGVRTQGFFIGFAVAALLVLIYAAARWLRERSLRWLLVIAFAAVIIQGVLGGLRVTLDEHGWGMQFGIVHGALAQLFFVLTGTIVLLTSKWWAKAGSRLGVSSMQRLLLFATGIVLVQLILGASMRHQHAGLAVPDFPLAYGKLWPAIDAESIALYNQHRIEAAGEHPITAAQIVLHMLHRITALVITVLIFLAARLAWRRTAAGSPMRKLAVTWVALVVVQIILGAFTVWSQRKVDVTTAHVAVGALTFMVGWLSFLIASRQGIEISHTTSGAEVLATEGVEFKHA